MNGIRQLALLAALSVAVGFLPRESLAAEPASGQQTARAVAAFHRGAALVEQYKYSDATKAFQEALKLQPDWVAARFNLGLAFFNMHGERRALDNLRTSKETFEAVLAAEPDHLHARFCLGLYFEYLGETEQALECFQAVYRRDPEDPHVAYKYAGALIAAGKVEPGTKVLEKLVADDPGFISGVYRLMLQYRRLRQIDKARELSERFRELEAEELAGGTFTVAYVYGTAGKYYQAVGADSRPILPREPAVGQRIVFSPRTETFPLPTKSWKWPGGSIHLPGVACGDVDGDGDLDLCLCGTGDAGGTRVWFNDGSGKFTAGPPITKQGVSPCLGDVDNDGDLDLWLGRVGAGLLLANDGQGQFRAIDPPLTDDAGVTSHTRLADIDSDGDLDLLALRLTRGSIPVAADAVASANKVQGNNRDGSFTDVTGRMGLELPDTPVAATILDDFDNDRDLDLLVFPASGEEPIAWVNDRAWHYRQRNGTSFGLDARGVRSVTSGDPNKDGRRDLLLFGEDGVQLYLASGRFRFERHEKFHAQHGRLGGTGGQFADMDNDGDLDIVIADARRRDGSRGPALLINDWPNDRFIDAAHRDPGNLLAAIETKGPASCVVADFTGNGRCDVLLAEMNEKPVLLRNLTPGGHWVTLDLQGTREKDNKSRSNRSAIGARVEIKTGGVFQQYVVGMPSGPVAMGPLRIHAGLGPNPKIDWLRITWPDAVLQAELEVAADRNLTVSEVQRKVSSCPCLFAWNGSHFEFVADFGGVGGLGYFLGPGSYARPDPTEYLRIPKLQPLDGEYVLQVLVPLEEVNYFDEAKLIAVDHPRGTHVEPHEMMAVSAVPPPFEVFCYRDRIEPVRAINQHGEDVTERIRQVDRRYAGATDPDPRFLGLAGQHSVELDFGDRLHELATRDRVVLFLYGWVEYGYSSTNFAASQAGLRAEAPSFQVQRDGKWVELANEVGYPAGLQHVMTLDLTGKLRPSDRKIRITSNMELYWDQIFLARVLADQPIAMKEIAPTDADLHFAGFPREYSPDGRHPNLYDYANKDRAVGWKLISGDYTRFGDVKELLDAADDCYVIMGRGEEVTLRFSAKAFGPVPKGCTRSFLLKTDSYCKDMDLYTAHPETVAPLPFHAMSGYPYATGEHYPDNEKTRQYRRRYNTRQIRVK